MGLRAPGTGVWLGSSGIEPIPVWVPVDTFPETDIAELAISPPFQKGGNSKNKNPKAPGTELTVPMAPHVESIHRRKRNTAVRAWISPRSASETSRFRELAHILSGSPL
jgi:hypothetical protein